MTDLSVYRMSPPVCRSAIDLAMRALPSPRVRHCRRVPAANGSEIKPVVLQKIRPM